MIEGSEVPAASFPVKTFKECDFFLKSKHISDGRESFTKNASNTLMFRQEKMFRTRVQLG